MRAMKRAFHQGQFPWVTDIHWRQVPDESQRRTRELLSQLLRKIAERRNNEGGRSDELQ